MAGHYNLIVVGGGPNRVSLVHGLAATDTRIQLIERGDCLPKSHAK